jgi:hypothetical protein
MNIKLIQSIVGKNLNEIQKKNYLINNNTNIFLISFLLYSMHLCSQRKSKKF